MKYNPFEKDIQELQLSDIQSLIEREIIEGWYIEYKSQFPKLANGKIDNIKVAKSISSFANTKGGWIFWGIQCTGNKPTLITGIDIKDFANFEDQVSQLINSNISPKPFYHFRTIQLENENIVFIIKVEESPTPPYITSQGTIFQRENNESKPIHDRYIIEKLNEKTDNYNKSIERFSHFKLPETKGQADWNQTYLELYLFPLPFDEFEFKKFYSTEFFENVSETFLNGVGLTYNFNDEESKVTLNLGFNSIYTSECSIIVRPLNENTLIYKSTTVELFQNGNLKFLFPIYEFRADDIPKNYRDSEVLNYIINEHSPKIKDEFVNQIKIIDGHELLITIFIIISMYKSILKTSEFDLENNIGFRARITEYWRKFIFFDNLDYREKIKKYNLPISPKNEVEIPEFKKGNAYNLNFSEEYEFITVAKFILESIGLPDSQSIQYADIIETALKRFQPNPLGNSI